MTDEVVQAAMVTWAARHLPARLDGVEAAKLLGFAEHDIQILMAVGKLTPLGDPAPQAPKRFTAGEMIRLAADPDWLHKASKEILNYERHKRERRQTSPVVVTHDPIAGCMTPDATEFHHRRARPR